MSTFEEVVSSLEPLSQVTSLTFEEAIDASFSQVFDGFTSQGSFEEHVPFKPPCSVDPTVEDTFLNIDIEPLTVGAALEVTAPTTAPSVASAFKQPPSKVARATQRQLPFKKRKSRGTEGDMSSAAKRKPPSPATPSTGANAPLAVETTPRGVEAALVISSIAKVRPTTRSTNGTSGSGADNKKDSKRSAADADENRRPQSPATQRQASSVMGKIAAATRRPGRSKKGNAAATVSLTTTAIAPRRAFHQRNGSTNTTIATGGPIAIADKKTESGRSKNLSADELEELKLVDIRKYKRIIGNRKSAATSKARKEANLKAAREECERLRKENQRLVKALEKAVEGGGGGGSGDSRAGVMPQLKPAKATKPPTKRAKQAR